MPPLTQTQAAATTPRNRGAHNFRVARKFQEWEAAVFDDAAYFTVVKLAPTPGHRFRTEYPTFAEARAHAEADSRTCLYAVTASGRTAQLDRAAYPAWAARRAAL